MNCSTPGSPVLHISQSFLKFIKNLSRWYYLNISSSVVPFSSCLQSLTTSGSFPKSRLFVIRWPKYWSFSISPSNEYSGLIPFRMDWLDLLAAQGTLKSLLEKEQVSFNLKLWYHSLKVSILWCSAFFMVQLSHLYMPIGKTIPLTRQTFVSKVTSLLFNMLSRFVMACLPSSKNLLIS